MATLKKTTCALTTTAPRLGTRTRSVSSGRASFTGAPLPVTYTSVTAPAMQPMRGRGGCLSAKTERSVRQSRSMVKVSAYQAIVQELADKIATDAQFQLAFDAAVEEARTYNVELVLRLIDSTEDYLDFADLILKTPPFQDGNTRNVYNALSLFYFILDQPTTKMLQSPIEPGSGVQELTWLSDWIKRYADDWGRYMDTPESAAEIDTFVNNAYFNWNDYIIPEGGFTTFNEYFYRHVKPELRPIANPDDDSVVVCPADACFVGWWNIDSDSTIFSQGMLQVKGIEWSIGQLLQDYDMADQFAGGVFTHSFLNTYNYHRWHAPVRGTVTKVQNIEGQCYLDVSVIPNFDGRRIVKVLNALDGTGYQFVQTRGLCVIDSPIGLVACLPMGMAQVSSVVFTVNEGDTIAKGQELGYFRFGGSDFVMVFQNKAQIQLLGQVNVQALVGQALGVAHGEISA